MERHSPIQRLSGTCSVPSHGGAEAMGRSHRLTHLAHGIRTAPIPQGNTFHAREADRSDLSATRHSDRRADPVQDIHWQPRDGGTSARGGWTRGRDAVVSPSAAPGLRIDPCGLAGSRVPGRTDEAPRPASGPRGRRRIAGSTRWAREQPRGSPVLSRDGGSLASHDYARAATSRAAGLSRTQALYILAFDLTS